MKWFFDGLGTEIISIVVGVIIGAISGYKYGVHKTIKQNQSGENHSLQKQIGYVEDVKLQDNKSGVKDDISQNQKAGDDSTQIQIGGLKNVK